jgi:Uma2 family endonuclease
MAIANPPPSPKARMTEEEFLRYPDDGRKYDLVDGEPVEVPAGFEHDTISINIAVRMAPYARGRGVLAGSQAGFRMVNGNIRSPDLSFTLKERLPGGKPGKGFGDAAPDLCIEIISPCIEIISPSEERAEMERKLEEYFASGAKQVWQLFPEETRARIYTSPTVFTDYFAEDEIEGRDLLPGFQCRVADLFDDGLS